MAAQAASDWQKEQVARVTAYKPARPEMPNDHRCATGDTECTAQTPPPPPGSTNEPFRSQTRYPTEWLALMAVASVAYVILTGTT